MAFIVFNQMLVLFTLMLMGYTCFKKQYITDSSARSIASIVVNVFNPALIISGVLEEPKDSANHELIVISIIAGAMYFFLIILAPILNKALRVPSQQRSLYSLITVFSNVGFIGLPLVVSIYGKQAILYVAVFILMFNILFYTYGVFIMGKGLGHQDAPTSLLNNLKRLINPGVLACILAILIFLLRPPLPDFIKSSISVLGSTAIPLSMMLVGVALGQKKLRTLFNDIRLYIFALIRLIIIPIIFISTLTHFSISPLIMGVSIIMIAVPVGNMPTLLATEYGIDATICSDSLIITTIFSLITIPLVTAIFM